MGNSLPTRDEPGQGSRLSPYSRREIWRAVIQGAALGILLGAAFAGGFFYRDMIRPTPESQLPLDLLREADTLLAAHYLRTLPPDQERVYGAVAGLVASLGDPHTYFVEPQTAEVDSTNLAGRFGGIGAEIGVSEDGRFVIVRVYRDNPGFEAGLRDGDVLLAVDGVNVSTGDFDLDGVISLVRGEIGSTVTLTVERNGQSLDVTIIRSEVLLPSVFWNLAEQDARIGYIRIVRFTDRTPDEMRQALSELKDQGAQAFVLDLRDNGGGLLDSAVDVVSEFLDGGVVLYEDRRDSDTEVKNASAGGLALTEPLAVLINAGTASASEIVAGALQDRGRAVLIGQTSFGKGTVQVILPMSDGSSLRVTTAEWFTPNHTPLEGNGLVPDRLVEPVPDQDVQLAAAVEDIIKNLASLDGN